MDPFNYNNVAGERSRPWNYGVVGGGGLSRRERVCARVLELIIARLETYGYGRLFTNEEVLDIVRDAQREYFGDSVVRRLEEDYPPHFYVRRRRPPVVDLTCEETLE